MAIIREKGPGQGLADASANTASHHWDRCTWYVREIMTKKSIPPLKWDSTKRLIQIVVSGFLQTVGRRERKRNRGLFSWWWMPWTAQSFRTLDIWLRWRGWCCSRPHQKSVWKPHEKSSGRRSTVKEVCFETTWKAHLRNWCTKCWFCQKMFNVWRARKCLDYGSTMKMFENVSISYP